MYSCSFEGNKLCNSQPSVQHVGLSKATQSTLLVSRPHPDENGCVREVIYSLFII